MKKHLLLTASAFVLATAGVVITKANAILGPAYYTDSAAPGFCILGTLPSGCTSINTGTICRIVSGPTFTYYVNSSCTSPYYRQP